MATPSLHPLLHYLRRLGQPPGGDRDDAQLLRRFLADRDESAFTMIVQRYGAMVWGLCVRRLGETPEAEDAFQATFLVLVRKASSLRGPELLGPWLYGVAYRTALKVRGQRARRAARETPLPEQLAEKPSEHLWRDLRPVIDEEVNRLPEKYRQPVLLCYLQGLSSEEAARRLGCAKGTIFSRLSRARDLLRRRLARRGVSVSAGALAAVLTEKAVVRAAPVALCETTIRMSLALVTGQTLSVPLAALVEGVLRSMFLNKVKFVVIVLLALGLVGSGAGFVAHQTAAGPPTPKRAATPNLRAGVADQPKEKTSPSKRKADRPKIEAANDPSALVAPSLAPIRLKEWRDKLIQPFHFDPNVDPDLTLEEFLDRLSKRLGINFEFNWRAFQEEEADVKLDTPVRIKAILAMKNDTSLATVLRIVLAGLPCESGAVYVLRTDSVEITTREALRTELRIPETRPLLPLVWDVLEDTPISKALAKVTETTSFNVIVDPHVKDHVQDQVSVQFNNVPVDTAVRLLANMAGLSVVWLDNVFFVTSADNAKRLREEQARANMDVPSGTKLAK